MPTTAWRFTGTEGADAAVLRLKQLDSQGLIDVHDVAVIRWPHYAGMPLVHEHVTEEGSAVTSFMQKFKHGTIDGSMIEAVKGDLTPGTSALVLLSTDAAVDKIAQSGFAGQGMELIRSDLSVQAQDQIRAALGKSAGTSP